LKNFANNTSIIDLSVLGNLALGVSMEKVHSLYGKELYSEKVSEPDLNLYQTILFYEGMTITITDELVSNIFINDKKFISNLDIAVNDNALFVLEYCDSVLEPFGGKENLGWYRTKDNNLIILYISEPNFRFNKNVEMDSVIQGIELLTGNEFD